MRASIIRERLGTLDAGHIKATLATARHGYSWLTIVRGHSVTRKQANAFIALAESVATGRCLHLYRANRCVACDCLQPK